MGTCASWNLLPRDPDWNCTMETLPLRNGLSTSSAGGAAPRAVLAVNSGSAAPWPGCSSPVAGTVPRAARRAQVPE